MEAMLAGNEPSLVLSENAGIHGWLGHHALSVNPFDIRQTADALRQAIVQPVAVRAKRAAAMGRSSPPIPHGTGSMIVSQAAGSLLAATATGASFAELPRRAGPESQRR